MSPSPSVFRQGQDSIAKRSSLIGACLNLPLKIAWVFSSARSKLKNAWPHFFETNRDVDRDREEKRNKGEVLSVVCTSFVAMAASPNKHQPPQLQTQTEDSWASEMDASDKVGCSNWTLLSLALAHCTTPYDSCVSSFIYYDPALGLCSSLNSGRSGTFCASFLLYFFPRFLGVFTGRISPRSLIAMLFIFFSLTPYLFLILWDYVPFFVLFFDGRDLDLWSFLSWAMFSRLQFH